MLPTPAQLTEAMKQLFATGGEQAREPLVFFVAGSVRLLIRESVLSGAQAMPSAPWRIPAAEFESDAVRAGVRALGDRCTRNPAVPQDMKTLRLPGLEKTDAR